MPMLLHSSYVQIPANFCTGVSTIYLHHSLYRQLAQRQKSSSCVAHLLKKGKRRSDSGSQLREIDGSKATCISADNIDFA